MRSSSLPTVAMVLCLFAIPTFADENAQKELDTNAELPNLGRRFTDSPAWSADRPYSRRNLVKRVAGDQKFLLTTWWPAETRRLSFSLPLGLALIGASQTGAESGGGDLLAARRFEGWSTGPWHGAAELFTTLGDAETAAVLIGGTYLISRWTGNRRLERTASLSGEALINTAIYVGVLKRVTRRTRPGGSNGEFFVSNPTAGQEPTSFPSGHATGAFAIVAIFASEYRERRWVPWVSYGTASLIALSRVALGRHFPSDVLTGAILGQSIGRMVAYRSNGLDEAPAPMWKRFRPYVDPETGGLGVLYQHSW